ncbi:MAG: hypothetical protein L0L14_01435 [Tetragenococcus koreensis]|nr:hypothetical protein [Tetragenococcus koreensis]
MTNQKKAKIILEALDKIIQVDWAMEKYYLEAIQKGLEEIDKKEHKK